MPHCIVEHSDAITPHIERLLDIVQHTVVNSPLFSANDVRTRAQVFDHYQLGATQQHFVHVTVRLLQGRSDREKAQLTRQVGEAIEQLSLNNVQISCECVEIHTPSYYRNS